MEATQGEYDIDSVAHIDTLRSEIKAIYQSNNPADKLADLLLNGHEGSGGYLTFGNNKIAKNTGIFNMNSAVDCPNAETMENGESETGLCQVEFSDCYAHKAENIYPNALKKRRLQEYLWDCVNPELFGEALLSVKSRKRSPFKHLRVSESGDFRHNGDIKAWDTVAKVVGDSINVYTYSASHKLSGWDNVKHFTVNQSNNLADYGDRQFTALPKGSELPEGMVWCPFDLSEKSGDDRPKCGECQLCINDEGPDVAIELH